MERCDARPTCRQAGIASWLRRRARRSGRMPAPCFWVTMAWWPVRAIWTKRSSACQFVEKAALILVHAQPLGGARPIPETLWREERDRYLYKYGKQEDLEDLL